MRYGKIFLLLVLVAPVVARSQSPSSSLPKEVMILDLKPGQVAIFNAKDLDKEGRAPVPAPGYRNILSVQKEKRWDDWAKAYSVYATAQKSEATAEAVRKGDYVGASLFETANKGNIAINLSVYGNVVSGLPVNMTANAYNASGASNQVIDLGEALVRQLRGGK